MSSATALATFAGGCFWCMEPPFDKLAGVLSTTSGYAGGKEVSTNYNDVSAGKTGHTEVVQIIYNPEVISYKELLDIFWRNINPTQVNGQFVDKGTQYRTEIFYHTDEQRKLALESKKKLTASKRFKKPIATKVSPILNFTAAEDYHQDYYIKNPLRYKYYRYHSGRDQYLEKVWGK